ncbi:MAG TPA: hypothetical protein DD381_11270 [Lentisphaeria bacterium]|nr:MAG: hypothetical protein A2W89_13510 [Bacteroidetes bacterium GWE2_42_39]HBM16909.1 hypothetical protein [Lentisphaeria bacterium]
MSKEKKTYRENLRFNRSVIHNFDLSIIIPFSNSMEEFLLVLPRNALYLQRNGIEVIIVMDSPEDEQALIGVLK